MTLTLEEQQRLDLAIESALIGIPMSDSAYTIRSNRKKLLTAIENAGFEILMDTSDRGE